MQVDSHDDGTLHGGTGTPGPSTGLPTGTVTFLLSDIEGSTRLIQRIPESDYADLLSTHDRVMRAAFGRRSGVVVATEGDSFFVVFLSPTDALLAAMEAQRGLADASWPGDEAIRVRVGILTGDGVLAGGTYVGVGVRRVAQIAAAGHGGQVLVGEATRGLLPDTLPGGLELRDLGLHRVGDSTELERLYQLVGPDLRNEFPPLRTLDVRRHNLPLELTTFIGREGEITEVAALVKEHRLLTLTGPGGTGKTRLAIQLGWQVLPEFADGVFFVPLAPIREVSQVPGAIAAAAGVRLEGSRSPVELLRDELGGRNALLILDNFEQVVEAAGTVVELLGRGEGLHIVVTSRTPLRLPGEQEWPVPPLRLPDPASLPALAQLTQYEAVALFIERARAVRPDFEVTNRNAPAVAEICVRLDGLPLAIELAAARTRMLTPDVLLERLRGRLMDLGGGPRDLPARQRTLRDAIAWSFDLLEPWQQTFYRRLSVFVGGGTFEAIERVCDPAAELGTDALEGITALVDASLLRRDEDATGTSRFFELETIREFGLECLASSGETVDIRRRHATWFLEFAQTADEALIGRGQAEWLGRMDVEYPNIRAALDWAIGAGETSLALRFAAHLWDFCRLTGRLGEGLARIVEILGLPGAQEPTIERADALLGAAELSGWVSDHVAGGRYSREALEIFRAHDDRLGIAIALRQDAYHLAGVGRVAEARPRFEESIRLHRELRDDREGFAVLGLAMTYLLVGDFAAAEAPTLEARDLYRRLGDPFFTGLTNRALEILHARLGHAALAAAAADEALTSILEADTTLGLAIAIDGFVDAALMSGDVVRAVRLAGFSELLKDKLGGELPMHFFLMADTRAAARPIVGDAVVDRAWTDGQAMTRDEAIAYARQAAAATAGSHG